MANLQITGFLDLEASCNVKFEIIYYRLRLANLRVLLKAEVFLAK